MTDQTTTIPKDWKEKTLEEVADVNSLTINRNYSFNEIEYVDVASVEERKLIETQKLKLENAPSRAKRIVIDNSILISTVRPNLKHYCFIKKAKPNLIASTGFAVVNSKEGKSDPYFLYNLLTTSDYTNFLIKVADSQTSTYPAFNPSIIQHSKFVLPPYLEQRAIASVFLPLDEKIELLGEQNKILEDTARAIFKEWFVNFNFPDATGKMIDSELGLIPEGWSVVNFDEIMKFTPGTYIPKEDYEINGDNFIYGSNSVMGNTNQKTHTGPIIILAKIGTYCGAIRFSQDDCWINNNAGGIQGLNISTAVIFEILKHFDFSIVREGSGQPYINMSGLKMQKVAIPKDLNSEILKKISQSIDTIYLKIAGNQKQIQILSKLRDTLLPKLIKGEVRIKEFDR